MYKITAVSNSVQAKVFLKITTIIASAFYKSDKKLCKRDKKFYKTRL